MNPFLMRNKELFFLKHIPIFLVMIFLIVGKAYAATIQTDPGKHWYIGGSVGTHFSSNGDTQIPSIASKPPLKSEPVYNAGSSLWLNIGYRFLQSFRIEGELAYQNLPMNKINNAIGVGTVTYVKNSYTNLFSTFINGYYDFNFYNPLIPYPYIGFGTGYVNVRNMIRPNPPIPVLSNLFFTKKEINYNTWGYQGMLGVIYQLTDNMHVSIDYKYFFTVKQDITGQTNLGPDRYETKQRITSNMISIGIKYIF